MSNKQFYWMCGVIFFIATGLMVYLNEKTQIEACAHRGDLMGLYTQWDDKTKTCYVRYKGRLMPLDWLATKWNY